MKIEDMSVVLTGQTTGSDKNPTFAELSDLVKVRKEDGDCNITVYDAETDEFYPVQAVCRADEDDVVGKYELVLVINHTEEK